MGVRPHLFTVCGQARSHAARRLVLEENWLSTPLLLASTHRSSNRLEHQADPKASLEVAISNREPPGAGSGLDLCLAITHLFANLWQTTISALALEKRKMGGVPPRLRRSMQHSVQRSGLGTGN